MKKTTLLICFVLCLSLPVWAGEKNENEETVEPTQEQKAIPEILDVDERDAEMYRIEFTPYFGTYLGDTLQNSYMAGAVLDFRLTPKLSLGVDFGWSPISVDRLSDFGSTVTNSNLYSIQGMLTLNMPAAFLSRKDVVETDFFTTFGGGVMRINNSTRGDGFIGGGMKMYSGLARWFAVRVEMRGYFSSLNTPSGSDFTTDWTITAGPTFMLPPRLF
jgi:hypothetical protein